MGSFIFARILKKLLFYPNLRQNSSFLLFIKSIWNLLTLHSLLAKIVKKIISQNFRIDIWVNMKNQSVELIG